MSFTLLLLFLLGMTGCRAEDAPEVLQTTAGSSVSLQCHYDPEDARARKVWCQFLMVKCQPLVTSAVDRRRPGSKKAYLTDLGEGLLEVVMNDVQVEDSGKYGCMVETSTGLRPLNTFILQVSSPGSRQDEEDDGDYLGETLTLAPMGYPESSPTFSPMEPNREDWSIPLIWGSVLLLSLLLVAAVVLAVMAGRRGGKLNICGRSQNSEAPALDTWTPAEETSTIPFVKLETPPSLDDTTYTNPPLGPPTGKPPPPPPPTKLEPKVHFSSKPVTYATVVFPPGAEAGEVLTQLDQEQTDLQNQSNSLPTLTTP
ncbi:trem-like transcript 1 protein [Sarcophilus harrisii]|uniref:Triggering receptor expressed on myeloid cells like 1 n=1 Tax=Sarcophilus harrisii TaxID=9305 RepID=G3X098_SARHA|nr:trem-like transcript 1 protein [Sarcophilus harrisii]